MKNKPELVTRENSKGTKKIGYPEGHIIQDSRGKNYRVLNNGSWVRIK